MHIKHIGIEDIREHVKIPIYETPMCAYLRVCRWQQIRWRPSAPPLLVCLHVLGPCEVRPLVAAPCSAGAVC